MRLQSRQVRMLKLRPGFEKSAAKVLMIKRKCVTTITYPFQTVAGVKYDRGQNDIEEDFWIKSCLEINLIIFDVLDFPAEYVSINFGPG